MLSRTAASAQAATIAPSSIPKYVTPLFVLPAMPPSGRGENSWPVFTSTPGPYTGPSPSRSTCTAHTTSRRTTGTFGRDRNPLEWFDPITENPVVNTTEIWEVWSFAAGGHDFHVHLVEFQVLGRRPISGGTPTPPNPWEVGRKDSVFASGGVITRIQATFDHVSRFVWHCTSSTTRTTA